VAKDRGKVTGTRGPVFNSGILLSNLLCRDKSAKLEPQRCGIGDLQISCMGKQ